MRSSHLSFCFLSILAVLAMFACGGELRMSTGGGTGNSNNNNNGNGDFALIGTWMNSFGSLEVITSTSWNSDFLEMAVVEHDNDGMIAYTQTSTNDMYNPNKFNKIEWTGLSDNTVYYCMVDYGLTTLGEAKSSTQTADSSNPDAMGCGRMFPWTKLSK